MNEKAKVRNRKSINVKLRVLARLMAVCVVVWPWSEIRELCDKLQTCEEVEWKMQHLLSRKDNERLMDC
jgi:hypothetical protein